jgi:hypothetical protein
MTPLEATNENDSIQRKRELCDQLKSALGGDIGEIVDKHGKMILAYYDDVQKQAGQSFRSAERVAKIGFWVLIVTLGYTLLFDALGRFNMPWFQPTLKGSLTVGGIGVVSGLLIEFIAAINFWLYGRASRQFSAFHICLERTHRYLIAYKIAETIGTDKDQILGKLVCIMANAPMITMHDISDESINPEP